MPNGSRINYQYKFTHNTSQKNFDTAFEGLLTAIAGLKPNAIGHRFVHGGDIADQSRFLNTKEIARLKGLLSLAPLHMSHNLFGVEYLAKHFTVPQVACFDTAFHATLPELAWRLPIPNIYKLRKYGFHGINYSHIAKELPKFIGEIAMRHIVVAHLGSGSSLCLMNNLKSIDTSMGLTPAGGIPMATRSGDLDPGLLLELAKLNNQEQLEDLVYHQMGLLALSNNESSDVSKLVESKSLNAKFAIEYFANQVRGVIGEYAAKAGGIDGIVFTGGIGEHSSIIRSLICDPMKFLGFSLDPNANNTNSTFLSEATSKPILMIPADEEIEIFRLVSEYLTSLHL